MPFKRMNPGLPVDAASFYKATYDSVSHTWEVWRVQHIDVETPSALEGRTVGVKCLVAVAEEELAQQIVNAFNREKFLTWEAARQNLPVPLSEKDSTKASPENTLS